jgi:diguanylate cyclase (GGDEF)-like protein
MTLSPPANDGSTGDALRRLTEIRMLTERTRARLKRLQHELIQTESALGNYRSAPPLESNAWLVEANNQLVVCALLARAEAESATSALQDASHTAGHDALTGLPNRTLLMDRLAHAVALAKRQAIGLAVLFLDIDAFKSINDRQGHDIGDEALKCVALRLLSCVREADTVGRLGGDEFVIVLTSVSGTADALLVAGKMLAALKAGYHASHDVLPLSASIGVSLFPEHGEDPATLIRNADTAMYLAKKYKTGSWVFGHTTLRAAADAGRKRTTGADDRTAHDPADEEFGIAQLREANEHLVLASLAARDLQATAERAQRAQNESLTLAAHELRSPLVPLCVAASLLSQAPAAELPQLQAVIERQTEHLTRLVGDLLDAARGPIGRLRVNLQTVDVVALLLASVDACRPGLAARAQHLRVDVPPADIYLQADPVRFAQIVRNLVDNARKYTPAGGSIDVSLRISGACVLLTVSDTGIGIPADALCGIFERLAPETHAIRVDGEEPGIGLDDVRELVRAHGGNIVATSAGRDRGSQFSITIPLTPKGSEGLPV